MYLWLNPLRCSTLHGLGVWGWLHIRLSVTNFLLLFWAQFLNAGRDMRGTPWNHQPGLFIYIYIIIYIYIYIYIIASKAMNWNFCKAMESTPPKSWVGSGSLTDASMCSCIYVYIYIYVCIYIYIYIYVIQVQMDIVYIYIYIIIQSQDTFHCQNVSYPIENRCIPHGPSCFPPWLQGIKTIAGPRRWPPGCGSWKLEGLGSGDVCFFFSWG